MDPVARVISAELRRKVLGACCSPRFLNRQTIAQVPVFLPVRGAGTEYAAGTAISTASSQAIRRFATS